MTPSAPRMRLDLALVERGFFDTRSRAQAAIEAGCVWVNGAVADTAARKVTPDAVIEAEAPHPWVSRGGVKLAAALDAFGIDPRGRTCLDIGASTGGFTEVLLTRGAQHVTAVDVGHGQLHPRLRDDARVVNLEGTDARRLTAADLSAPPSLIVVDASFIALSKVLVAALALAAPDADLVALVKPQFEVGRDGIGKGGIVKDAAMRQQALDDVISWLRQQGWRSTGHMPSPIQGGDGNEEYLLAARRD